MTPRLVLYGRPGCHLCDEARTLLERIRKELPFALVERDHRNPLQVGPEKRVVGLDVALDGEELFDFFVDEETLKRLILYREAR